MSGVNLVMPMAGRGSRFATKGIPEPKPLIDLGGHPFFWWATESVRRQIPISRVIFVILEEHARDWSLDRRILALYPTAEILAIPEVTSGSAETAALAAARLDSNAPLLINDCDHAFLAPTLPEAIAELRAGTAAGTLVTFRSESPNYSYLQLSSEGTITGTVEKQVASPYAIAGCYLFRTSALFLQQYEAYRQNCPYPELFISGIYNQMLGQHLPVTKLVLGDHFAFGTPTEYANVQARLLDSLSDWS